MCYLTIELGAYVKFMDSSFILTMQRRRPNFKIRNYVGLQAPKVYKLTPMVTVAISVVDIKLCALSG